MAPLQNQGCCITMDNRFSSPDLYKGLCRSLMLQNRKSIPDATKKTTLKKEEHVSVCKDKLMIMK
jgi:hypothetical protein